MTVPSLKAELRRDRAVVALAIALLVALAWTYLVWLARTMSLDMPGTGGGAGMAGMPGMGQATTPPAPEGTGAMGGMAGGMARAAAAPTPAAWTPATAAFVAIMWAVMMVGMMLPSATPMILIYARVARQAAARGRPLAATAWFALGYVLCWIGFALVATAVQWALARALLLTPMMASASGVLSGLVLILAGAYQWTSLKRSCLAHCQSPLAFIMRHGGFRPGAPAALALGFRHGAYCVGCCWALMAVLFVVGVMNIFWIALLALLVLAEKLVPRGGWIARISGLGFAGAGAWALAQALV